MYTFTLTDEDMKKVKEWHAEQDAIVYKQQLLLPKSSTIRQMAEMFKGAYYGACGGELTYSFAPTTIGLVAKVQHSGTNAELDLTDYDSF